MQELCKQRAEQTKKKARQKLGTPAPAQTDKRPWMDIEHVKVSLTKGDCKRWAVKSLLLTGLF